MSKRERIMLTRSAEDCARWAAELAQRGVDPIVFPCIDTEIIDTAATRARLRRALRDADWLVFTSQRGVGAFVALAGSRVPSRTRIATVGAATAGAAQTEFGRAELIGERGTAADLADDLLAAAAPGERLLLVLAANAAATLERKLAVAGHDVSRVDVYRTIPKPMLWPKRAFSTFAADWVFLASPSSSTGFTNQVELDCAASAATIGPTTTAAARDLGFSTIRQAREQSLSGLLEAIGCPART